LYQLIPNISPALAFSHFNEVQKKEGKYKTISF